MIGFNAGDKSESSDWEPVAPFEICHALGWITGNYNTDGGLPRVADLYRYSAPESHQWTGGQPAYFSIDGGNTDLADFSTSLDYTLFPNVPVNDPLRIPFESSAQTLTSLDIEALSVIGFGLQPPAPTVVLPLMNSCAGDFNGDGHSDSLWQSTSGRAEIWEMNGTKVIGDAPAGPNPGPSWHAVGTGDFNDDRHSDILWQNTSGQAEIWEMSGTNVIGGGPVAPIQDRVGERSAELVHKTRDRKRRLLSCL